METQVRNAEAGSRYELLVDGEVVGIADYRCSGDAILLFPHTEIAPARRGRGLGTVLVRGALDDVRRRGHKVIPECSFVRRFLDEHPDYADLAA